MADNFDRDTHDHDLTYENEQSTVTIPLKEYDRTTKNGLWKGIDLKVSPFLDRPLIWEFVSGYY